MHSIEQSHLMIECRWQQFADEHLTSPVVPGANAQHCVRVNRVERDRGQKTPRGGRFRKSSRGSSWIGRISVGNGLKGPKGGQNGTQKRALWAQKSICDRQADLVGSGAGRGPFRLRRRPGAARNRCATPLRVNSAPENAVASTKSIRLADTETPQLTYRTGRFGQASTKSIRLADTET